MANPTKYLKKGQRVRLLLDKHIQGHHINNNCGCLDEATNTIEGVRVWTRIIFDCGVIMKINCQCIELINE